MQVTVLPTSEFNIIQGVTKKTEDFRASMKLLKVASSNIASSFIYK